MDDVRIDFTRKAENSEVARQIEPRQQLRSQAEIERSPTSYQKERERSGDSSWSGASAAAVHGQEGQGEWSMSGLDKWHEDDKALEIERQRMKEALARVGETRVKETRAAAMDRGRLVFVLDLTGSREHSLKQARIATAAMFDAIRRIGAVAVKLIYYRGNDECRESGWHDDPAVLSRSMARLCCETGMTQIARALRRALAVAEKLSGVVFVGDQCEENAEDLAGLAALLGRKTIPLFVFHECADDNERSLAAKPLFKRMAAASGGFYSEFKPDSGATLRELLSSVGAFSAAGVEGLRKAPLPQTAEARELRGRLLMLPSSEKSAGRFDLLRRKG